jgi:hypothetical protein
VSVLELFFQLTIKIKEKLMTFLSRIYDFMFAPAGTFDPSSGLYDAANDPSISNAGNSPHYDTHIAEINPATGLPMIDCGDGTGTSSGLDIGGSPFGIDVNENDDCTFVDDSSMFSNDCNSMFDHTSSSTDSGCKFD